MKKLILIAAAVISTNASAGVFSVGRVQLNGGAAIFELHTEISPIPECQRNGFRTVVLKLESPKGVTPYGTGCWRNENGEINIAIEDPNTGYISTQRLPASVFEPIKPPMKARKLIDIAEGKVKACYHAIRDFGEGAKTDTVCYQVKPAVDAVKAAGWCWSSKTKDTEPGWEPCN